MAKKIKFALKMKDGAEARSLQELQENFDLNLATAYFLDGRLESWLEDRYYDEQLEQVRELEKEDPHLQEKLCQIFGIEYTEESMSVEAIAIRERRISRLREITEDEEILSHVDQVAFSQEELADLLDEGADKIYLCGKDFKIPERMKNKTYIGINTKLSVSPEKKKRYRENHIQLIDLLEETEEDFDVEREDGIGKGQEGQIKKKILEALQKYGDQEYQIWVRPYIYEKAERLYYKGEFKSRFAAKREAEGKLKKAYEYADQCLKTGNSASLSTKMAEKFAKEIEPDVIAILNMLENGDERFKDRNKIILEQIKSKLDIKDLKKQALKAAEEELQSTYYQTILEPFGWYTNFINYDEFELYATGLFQKKYEYSYDGLEASELIDQHVTMAAETFSSDGTEKIKREIIKPVIELADKLEE